MKTVMVKYFKFGIIAALALLLGSCTEADKFDPNKEVLVMTGTDSSPLLKFTVEDTPATYPISVSATGKVKEDVIVNIKIDNSLVDKYNADNKTSYFKCPESALNLEKTQVVIAKGQASSDISLLSVISDEELIDGRIYIIPVTITEVKGGPEVLESSRTIYLRISRVIYFRSLDMNNTNLYSNFIFEDEQAIDLPTYTYEIKCYINSWHNTPEQISRLCSWTSKSEARSLMLRFGENGQDINSLQLVTPGGNLISTKRFETGVWYTLSMTFDGSTFRFYVDGQRDGEVGADCSNTFQRFELGMSWENYPSKQYFNGRVAEIRVWDRALSASEIQLGLCGVDTQSEGLRAYWKMNDSDHIFRDATGNGYDMDWSNTVRDNTGNGTLNSFDKSSYVRWIEDDKNRCVN